MIEQEMADAAEHAAHSGPHDDDPDGGVAQVFEAVEVVIEQALGSSSARTRALGERMSRDITRLRRVVSAEADAARAKAAAEAAKEAVREAWSGDGDGDGTDG